MAEQDRLTFAGGLVTDANPTTATPDSCNDLTNFTIESDNSIRTRRRVCLQDTQPTLAALPAGGTLLEWFAYEWPQGQNEDDILVRVDFIEKSSGQKIHRVHYIRKKDQSYIACWETNTNASFAADSVFSGAEVVGDGFLLSFSSLHTMTPIVGGDTFREFRSNEDTLSAPTLVLVKWNTGGWFQTQGFTPRVRDYTRTSGTTLADRVWNAKNAGWTHKLINAYRTAKGFDPEDNLIGQLGVTASGTFSIALLEGQQLPSTPAPNGSHVGSPFTLVNNKIAIGTGAADWNSGGVALTVPPTPGTNEGVAWSSASHGAMPYRILSMVAQGGRVWFLCKCDVQWRDRPSLARNFILYTRVGTKVEDYRQCHTINDPTSPFTNTTLPTDGGYLILDSNNNPFKMEKVGEDIAVFGDKGITVLNIQGVFDPTKGNVVAREVGSGVVAAYDPTVLTYHLGNTLNTFEQDLISYKCQHPVAVEDTLFFLTKAGIEVLTRRENTDTYITKSLSSGRLDSFFKNIPTANLGLASGLYNPDSKTISWLFSRDASNKDAATTILNYSLMQNRFSVYELGNAEEDTISFYGKRLMLSDDIAGAIQKTDIDGPGLNILGYQASNQQVAYTWKFEQSTNPYTLPDFLTSAGAEVITDGSSPYVCTLETNEINLGDTMRPKTGLSLTMNFARAERATDGSGDFTVEGTCKGQVLWDYAVTGSTRGIVAREYQLYRLGRVVSVGDSEAYDYGQDTITTHTKFRGRGKAVRLKLSGEPGKLTHILSYGYSIKVRSRIGR